MAGLKVCSPVKRIASQSSAPPGLLKRSRIRDMDRLLSITETSTQLASGQRQPALAPKRASTPAQPGARAAAASAGL